LRDVPVLVCGLYPDENLEAPLGLRETYQEPPNTDRDSSLFRMA
jgi:hypothetical protein